MPAAASAAEAARGVLAWLARDAERHDGDLALAAG
jgi:hypothetical protein